MWLIRLSVMSVELLLCGSWLCLLVSRPAQSNDVVVFTCVTAQVASKAACSGLAAALLLTGSLSVVQPAYALTRAEQEQEVLKQREKLEFALKLQENARKAALLAK